jgi:hypothetical protein
MKMVIGRRDFPRYRNYLRYNRKDATARKAHQKSFVSRAFHNFAAT